MTNLPLANLILATLIRASSEGMVISNHQMAELLAHQIDKKFEVREKT